MMKLSLEDLYSRHDYWRKRIGEKGIWEAEKFLPAAILIRKHHKTYNGLFQRRWIKGDKEKTLVDRIVIYNNSEDFEEGFVNSVLVHEMIHQYIIQNEIKDTSSHGKVFKTIMSQINSEFYGELEITLRTHNPNVLLKGPGNKVHTLLIMEIGNDFYCCIIRPSKIKEFENMIRKNKKLWHIKKYMWGVSKDVYFNLFSRCTTRLHGIKKPIGELPEFIKSYNIVT